MTSTQSPTQTTSQDRSHIRPTIQDIPVPLIPGTVYHAYINHRSSREPAGIYGNIEFARSIAELYAKDQVPQELADSRFGENGIQGVTFREFGEYMIQMLTGLTSLPLDCPDHIRKLHDHLPDQAKVELAVEA